MANLKTDLAGILDKLDRKVYRLEQTVTSSEVMGQSNKFDEIEVGGTVVSPTPPDVPGNPSATSTAFYDLIAADLSWDEPENGLATGYEVELVKVIDTGPPLVVDLVMNYSATGTSWRLEGLIPGQDYAFRVRGANILGFFTGWSDYFEFTAETDTTIPDPIADVVLTRGATSLIVTFAPSAEVDVEKLKGRYEVQVDTANTFDSSDLRSTETTSWVLSFSDIRAEDTWYGRVRAIDSSGNAGLWSAVASTTAGGIDGQMLLDGAVTEVKLAGQAVTTAKLKVGAVTSAILADESVTVTKITDDAVTTPKIKAGAVTADEIKALTITAGEIAANAVIASKIQAGAVVTDKLAANSVVSAKIAADQIFSNHIKAGQVDTDHIVAAGLSAATIKFGSMSGDRITANSLDVNKLKTSTLTATTITLGPGGSFKIGSPPANGLFINDQGITAYHDSSQTLKIASNGQATFSGVVSGATIVGGTISSASDGQRVTISSTEAAIINFWPGSIAIPGQVYSWYDSPGTEYGITLHGPAKTNGSYRAFLSLGTGSSGLTGDRIFMGANQGVAVLGILYPNDGIVSSTSIYAMGGVIQNNNGPLVSLSAGDKSYLGAVVGGLAYTLLAPTYNRTTGGGANVNVDSGGYLRRSTSSKRYKKDITEANFSSEATAMVATLPITFRPRDELLVGDEETAQRVGYLAETLDAALGERAGLFVEYDEEGRPDAISYDRLVVLAFEAIRGIESRMETLEASL